MKFALLGVDEDVWRLAQSLAARDEHELAAIFEPGNYARELFRLAPHAETSAAWDTLALEGVVDAVIIGRGAPVETRIEQLKVIVQALVPVVALHPACEYIVGYELEMIRADVGGTLVPYYPGMLHPLLRELPQLVGSLAPRDHARESPFSLGSIAHLAFERSLAVRERDAVLAQLARDADMIRQVLGPIKQVSAMGNLPDHGPVQLSVQMTTTSGILARWSLEPVVEQPRGLLTLTGSEGKAICQLPPDAPWHLKITGPVALERVYDQFDEPALLCEQLAATLGAAREFSPAWLEVCRAAEIAETTPRCIRRGKTIELFNEELTEASAFKGVMAVGGCLFLMLGLLVLFIVAMVEGVGIPAHRFGLWANWPVYLFAAFFGFLLLQLLQVFARGNAAKRKPPTDKPPPEKHTL
jgi:hypothetical protein